MKSKWLALLAAASLLQPLVHADVTYQETTKITGGSLKSMLKLAGAFSSQARQAEGTTVTTISLHGNRMVRSNSHTTEIIDLDQRAMTFIDHDKHSYYVVTFQQMEQAMTNAAAKAKQQGPAVSRQQSSAGDAQMSFKAHVSSNGSTRTIDGMQAKEALLTVTMLADANDGSNVKAGMAATTEMWLVPEVEGMKELRSFNERMAQELSFDTAATQMSGMLAAQPGGAEALADLKRESLKMRGLPVLQVTRVGISTDGQPLPPPSVAPMPDTQDNSSGAGNVTREVATDTGTQTANSELGKLGTFGRAFGSATIGAFTRHKPSTQAASPSSSPSDAATAGVLLESQTSVDHFSTAPADTSGFDVPAGYKQVKSPM